MALKCFTPHVRCSAIMRPRATLGARLIYEVVCVEEPRQLRRA